MFVCTTKLTVLLLQLKQNECTYIFIVWVKYFDKLVVSMYLGDMYPCFN